MSAYAQQMRGSGVEAKDAGQARSETGRMKEAGRDEPRWALG